MASKISSKEYVGIDRKEVEVQRKLPEFLQRIQDCMSPLLNHSDKLKEFKEDVSYIRNDTRLKPGQRLNLLERHFQEACNHFTSLADGNVRAAHVSGQATRYYSQLHQAAAKVLEAAKGLVPAETGEGEKFRASIQGLEMVMRNHADPGSESAKVEKSEEKLAPNPHVLPEAEKLLGDLNTLSTFLQSISEDIANPELMTTLDGKREAFTECVIKDISLSKSVKRKLGKLEKDIKAFNKQEIPKEHLQSIALFERSTKKDIKKELEKRKAVHEQRLDQHDKLAETWALCLIRKEAIRSKLWHIEKHTSPQADVVQLARDLGELSKPISALKIYLRGTSEPETKLENAKRDFNEIRTTYWLLKHKEQEYKDGVITLIEKELPEAIENGSMTLKEKTKSLEIFDPDKKADIDKELDSAVNAMSEEQKSFLQSMTTTWESVQKMLYEEFSREIQRLGFSIFENNGKIPYDWAVSWGLRKSTTDYTKEPVKEEKE